MFRAFTISLLMALIAIANAQLKGKVICIDPGHPSEVGRGTKGKKLTEMEVVWDMAQMVRTRLEKMGAKVVLTKSKLEEPVKNRKRAEIANEAKADLMLRLHCDAANGRGFATYYPTKQGKSQGVTGPSADLIKRLPPIAKRFHTALEEGLKRHLKSNGLRSDTQTLIGGRQGALTGSIFSKVPVVLVELVVLTNAEDEAFIATQKGQQIYADALAKAIVAAVSK